MTATESRSEYKTIGQRATRVEGATKVSGSAVYAADVQVPHMLHRKLVLSPHPHARIVSIDAAAALAAPGVERVITAEDMSDAVQDGSNPAIGASNRGDALLAHGEAVFAGQPVAAVLAETVSAAEEGAAALAVEYEELPAVLDIEAAMREDSPLARSPVSDVDRTEEDAHVTIDVEAEERAHAAALRREAMGFGDVTLMSMIGAFLGWQACLMIFFLAPFFGLAFALFGWIVHRQREIPYGPFLCAAALVAIFRWAPLWRSAVDVFALGWIVPALVAVSMVLLGVLLLIYRLIGQLLTRSS